MFYLWFFSGGVSFRAKISQGPKSVIKDVLTVLQGPDVSRQTTHIAHVRSPVYVYGFAAFSQLIEQGGEMRLLVG